MPGDLGDLGRLSRVELEPVMRRAAVLGDAAEVEAIRAELAGRTWQNLNPYAVADPPDPARRTESALERPDTPSPV
jgi:hypothetical protein